MILAIDWDASNNRLDITFATDSELTRLRSAIVISLFTDARVPDAEVPDGEQNRGWWGDYDQTQSMGSRLWLLARAKITADTINAARDYVRDATQWLVDAGRLLAITVTVERLDRERLAYQLDCQLPSGTWEKIVMEQSYDV